MTNATLPDDVEKLSAELPLGVAPPPVDSERPGLHFYVTNSGSTKGSKLPGVQHVKNGASPATCVPRHADSGFIINCKGTDMSSASKRILRVPNLEPTSMTLS